MKEIPHRICRNCDRKLTYKTYDSYRGSKTNTCKSCALRKARTNDSKHNFNKNYFEKIDTPKKAYVFGFILADGSSNGKVMSLIINKRDIDILYKIQDEIGETHFRKSFPYNDSSALYYSSVKMCEDLEKLGVVKNKTHKTYFPKDMEEGFIRHFIRGYFDGDGGICINKNYYNRPTITFTGNDKIILPIKDIIDNRFNLIGHINCRHVESPNIITLSYNGNVSSNKILSWLYLNSDIHLDRKYKLFKEIYDRQKKRDKHKIKDKLKKLKSKLLEDKKLREDTILITKLLDSGYSKRQVNLQFGIPKMRINKIIKNEGINYPERRRMFEKDPNRKDKL